MNWPWVSVRKLDALQVECDLLRAQQLLLVDREAYEAVRSERDRLREQNDNLVAHFERLDRHDNGLPEQPRVPAEEIGPMPREMREHMKGWPRATRDRQTKLAIQERRKGKSWEDVWAEMQAQMEER